MSGGSFDHRDFWIRDIAEQIREVIENNDVTEKNKWGDTIGRGYPKEVIEKFQEAVALLERAGIMTHRIDWLLAGDDGEENFLRRLEEDLARIK